MGLSSLAVVMGIIGQVYAIDFKVNQLYQKKFQFSRIAQHIGSQRSRALGLNKNDQHSRMAFRMVDLKGDAPELHTGYMINVGGKGGKVFAADKVAGGFQIRVDPLTGKEENVTESQGVRPLTGQYGPHPDTGEILRDGQAVPVAGVSRAQLDANKYEHAEPGTIWATKEEAESMSENYLRELNAKEKEIDMELEELKARRTALNAQKDEFTKFVGEGIKSTFKNNYA